MGLTAYDFAFPTLMFSAAPASTSSDSISTTVVCLVDDDSSVRKSIGRLLQSAGFEVHAFGDPEVFLQHLAANPVPLVILDIWMEPMTGLELLVHLRARAPQTRVIFITGYDDTAAELAAKRAGAVAFFRKPFDDEQFLRAVRSALSHELIGSGRS